MSRNKGNEAITWLQFNNIFPILVTLVTTTLSIATIYYKLNSKVDLAIQKLDYISEKIDTHLAESSTAKVTAEARYRELTDLRGEVNVIKYQLKINR